MPEEIKERIINYINEKRRQRELVLHGEKFSSYEMDMQKHMFLGVDMVTRWIHEMD